MNENGSSATTYLCSAFEVGFKCGQIESTVSSFCFSFFGFKNRVFVIYSGETVINIETIIEVIRYRCGNETNIIRKESVVELIEICSLTVGLVIFVVSFLII